MLTEASVEQRLVSLESAVAEMRCQLQNGTPNPNWLQRFDGAFKDEPAFAEVIEYGRALRAADRPAGD